MNCNSNIYKQFDVALQIIANDKHTYTDSVYAILSAKVSMQIEYYLHPYIFYIITLINNYQEQDKKIVDRN